MRYLIPRKEDTGSGAHRASGARLPGPEFPSWTPWMPLNLEARGNTDSSKEKKNERDEGMMLPEKEKKHLHFSDN